MPILPLTARPPSAHPKADPAAFVRADAIPAAGRLALDLGPADDVAALAPQLNRIALIRIGFPGFADGRGFSLGQRLRQMGFAGRLRATGPLIPDQRAALTGCGFDEVELPADLLARQGGAAAWAAAEPALPPFRRRMQARPGANAA